MFRSIWFLSDFADDVEVHASSVSLGATKIITWTVTFVNSSSNELTFSIGPHACAATNYSFLGDGWCDYDTVGSDKVFDLGNLPARPSSSEYNNAACQFDGGDCCADTCRDGPVYACGKYSHAPPNARAFSCLDPKHSKTRATVKILTPTSVISGDFQLSVGGYRTLGIPHDASASAIKAFLKQLPSVHDGKSGDIEVGRRGPDKQGGYTWYVCFTEPLEVTSDLVPVSRPDEGVALVGSGVSVNVRVVRRGAEGFGKSFSRTDHCTRLD